MTAASPPPDLPHPLPAAGGRRPALFGAVGGAAVAAVASVGAALCCVGPVALTLLGVNGMILAAGLKPFRWYLLIASGGFLLLAYWTMYRRRPGESASCSTRSHSVMRFTLWASATLWIGALILQFVGNVDTL